MHGRLILAGGGSEIDSLSLDEKLATWLSPHGKMLYLPIALRGLRPLEICYQWICATFAPLNINHIKMWTNLIDHRASELDQFDAVYIGGGNTYSLLAQLLESGFDRYLQAYFGHGGIIYGGSAGAAVLGKDIRSVSHLDSNETGLLDTNGLNLLGGHCVWVHYQPEEDEMITEYIQKNNHPVLAISERSGIVLEDGNLYSVGYEPAYRFDDQGKKRV